MGLVKPPGILTFLLALILGIVGALTHFGVNIPIVDGHGFWLVFAAYVLLIIGCLLRGM